MPEVDTSIYKGHALRSHGGPEQDHRCRECDQQNRLLGQSEQSNALTIEDKHVDLMMKKTGITKNLISSYLGDPDIA